MKTYETDINTYEYLKQYFGMEFFHKIDDNGKILIQPITDAIFKDMVRLCGKGKFSFVEYQKSNLEYRIIEGGRL